MIVLIISEFSTPGTQNETGTDVINQLAVLANAVGVSNSTFFDGMQYGSEYDASNQLIRIHRI